MCVHKKAGFLTLKLVCKVVWDSESEGAGPSSDTIIYLGNSMMYGAEIWQIPTREINKILSTEMDVLRRSARKSRI
jgi:hypothetical protein